MTRKNNKSIVLLHLYSQYWCS